jgi:hypothetical protein
MSAIDVYVSIDKHKGKQGEDRVRITLDGKFLPHIEQASPSGGAVAKGQKKSATAAAAAAVSSSSSGDGLVKRGRGRPKKASGAGGGSSNPVGVISSLSTLSPSSSSSSSSPLPTAAESGGVGKRPVGRPRKQLVVDGEELVLQAAPTSIVVGGAGEGEGKRGRGRPKGSKNKPSA